MDENQKSQLNEILVQEINSIKETIKNLENELIMKRNQLTKLKNDWIIKEKAKAVILGMPYRSPVQKKSVKKTEKKETPNA